MSRRRPKSKGPSDSHPTANAKLAAASADDGDDGDAQLPDRPGAYPADYEAWLFGALDLQPGDEVGAEYLEQLYGFNRRWVEREDSAPPLADGEAADAVADAPSTDMAEASASALYADDMAAMRAYALYYMTIYMPKLWFVLDRSTAIFDRLSTRPQWSVTEVGCGPGTFLWALLFYLEARRPELLKTLHRVRGVDQGEAALALASRLGEALKRRPGCEHLHMEWTRDDWRPHLGDATDLLIAGNTLNELPDLPPALFDPVKAEALILLEPGTRAVFHRVLPIRDRLLAGPWDIHFPCPSSHRCPMALDNWCHFRINRFALPFIQRMSNRAHRLNPRHHFVGFTLLRSAAEQQVPTSAPDSPAAAATKTAQPEQWRVLSALRKANRCGIRYLCDGRTMVEVVLNRRERSEQNRLFLDALAGDAFTLVPAPRQAPFARRKKVVAGDAITPAD